MTVDDVLILKEVIYKENDKILHALSRENGKIQLLSKGAKKSNSHLINVSQLFAHSRCSFAKTKDMYVITHGELIDNFYEIKNSMEAFYYGSYILELIGYVAEENETDSRIFDMTVSLLKYMCMPNINYKNLTAAYELKLASMLGYRPDFTHCLSCGSTIKGSAKFLIHDGGLICEDCVNNGNGINVSYGEILTMERILKIKFEHINSVDATPNILKLIRNFLFYYIGKDNFTTLKLL